MSSKSAPIKMRPSNVRSLIKVASLSLVGFIAGRFVPDGPSRR